MKKNNDDYFGKSQALPVRMARAWNDFWFKPGDPTVLGLIRVTCGLVTLYTLFVYSFKLQDLMGENAWYDLRLRMEIVRDRPQPSPPLDWREQVVLPPSNDEEALFFNRYRQKFNDLPLAPHPKNLEQAKYIEHYREWYEFDLRANGLRPPETAEEKDYLERYTDKHHLPPPAYELDDAKQAEIDDYIAVNGHDPRKLYARGMPVWSLWFHITNPTAMAWIHGAVVFIAFLFTIGFCTRITSALTWMSSLWYIHRNPVILFGVDTMMVILLLYLTIGPSGAAYSVDRLIARWWSENKVHCINRWRRFWGQAPLNPDQIQPAVFNPVPQPSVGANFAIRLLQVHLCAIYFVAGISKLQGQAWWYGTAVWGTLANYEFAPMQFEIYNTIMRLLGRKQWLFEIFMTSASMFTLAFEIAFAFLIWRSSTRWLILWGAIILHGFIGLFMGLKTFSLMMLVMNMGFVKPEEVKRVLNWFRGLVREAPPAPTAVPKPRAKFDAAPPRPQPEPAAAGSHQVKEKK